MNISLVRHIDYWVGVPLCLLLSILNIILDFFKIALRKKKNTYQNILFIKLSEMGAIVLSYPLIKSIKKLYPDAEIFFVTFARNKEIFKLFEGLVKDRNIFTIREDSAMSFVWDTFKVVFNMRREKIDMTLDLEFFSRFTAILTYLSKARKRIGFARYTFEGLYRGNLLTHNIQFNPLSHIVNIS